MTAQCNCQQGMVTEQVKVEVRIMAEHRSEVRSLGMCAKCAAATRENGLAVA
jgi:hypothetical protein